LDPVALGGTEPRVDPSLDLFAEIGRLKRERNAVVLAHYYQDPDIQDVADFIGDSLQLSQAAKATTADVIVFAGVHFMAETAKILNPDKVVVLPDLEAGCSLADACPADALAAMKRRHPDHVVVSYINCSAEVKAISDILCTSSNAVRVIRSVSPDRPILFAPDRNLGRWLMKQAGREMLLWPGSCIVHETFSERRIRDLVARHPDAIVLAHPECEEPVLRLAHFVGSTAAIIRYAEQSDARAFIVATESGILHEMKKRCPDKELIPAPPEDAHCACNECPHMKRNSLEKLYLCMRDLSPRLELDDGLRRRALKSVEAMLALG